MLPHLFGWKMYPWARKFFESRNKFNFLCSANQCGKSTIQIRKAIHWATNKELWPTLWRTAPTQFWYLYPSKDVCTAEYHTKWVPELLPKKIMKTDSKFGWTPEFRSKHIDSIYFNSGVRLYFKSYEQDVSNLQTSTVYSIFCDEELPFHMFGEFRSRLIATYGYYHQVFTATLGQDEWRRTMEPENKEEELFPAALKLNASLYDCLKYEDETPSFWTRQRIREIEAACVSEAEIQKRVYGRFVVSSGLRYSGFSRKLNMTSDDLPKGWHVYTGVDIGSGGENNHPASIIFVAVNPEFTKGIVFQGWRGEGVVTTSADILQKYQDMLWYNGKKIEPLMQSYDYSAKDFSTIASRMGIGFSQADKRRDVGENILNTLFKSKMLSIKDDDPELNKLVVELTSLNTETIKTRAKDDLIDALRYAVVRIPWDFTGFKIEDEIKEEQITEEQRQLDEREREIRERRGENPDEETRQAEEIELDEWQAIVDGEG